MNFSEPDLWLQKICSIATQPGRSSRVATTVADLAYRCVARRSPVFYTCFHIRTHKTVPNITDLLIVLRHGNIKTYQVLLSHHHKCLYQRSYKQLLCQHSNLSGRISFLLPFTDTVHCQEQARSHQINQKVTSTCVSLPCEICVWAYIKALIIWNYDGLQSIKKKVIEISFTLYVYFDEDLSTQNTGGSSVVKAS